jgi:hypothetical protein
VLDDGGHDHTHYEDTEGGEEQVDVPWHTVTEAGADEAGRRHASGGIEEEAPELHPRKTGGV